MRIKGMNNKAVSLPILLLVITSLVLSIISLTYFIIKENNIHEIISVSSQLDQIYLKELLLNFYVQDVFDKSVVGIRAASSTSKDVETAKIAFIDNFRKELVNYKDKNSRYPVDELALVELKILEDNIIDSVELNEEKLIFRLPLTIRTGYTSAEDDISLSYDYIKEFEKVFK